MNDINEILVHEVDTNEHGSYSWGSVGLAFPKNSAP